MTRLAAALLAGAGLAWLLFGSIGSVGAATGTGSDTATGSGGAGLATATTTVTAPARTDTVTETSTASAPPGTTTSVTNRTATVQVNPLGASTTSTDQSSNSGLPWWGWALIVLGAVVIGLVMYMVGRGRGKPPSGTAGTSGSAPAADTRV